MKTPEEQAEEYFQRKASEFIGENYSGDIELALQIYMTGAQVGYAAAREWHPISPETPRDGTRILAVCYFYSDPIIIMWVEGKLAGNEFPGEWVNFESEHIPTVTPTHWQPLPEPPKE